MDNEPIRPAPPGEYDAALREKHLALLTGEGSKALYDRTLRQCLERPDGVKSADLDMIFDLCAAEDVKLALMEDIRKRGVTVETRNGRQVFRKENPSMARMCRYAELQRRIRSDLRLTPAKRAVPDEPEPEETEDEFEAL